MLVKSADRYKSFNPSRTPAPAAGSARAAAPAGKRSPADLYADDARSAARRRVSTAGKSSDVDQKRVKCHDELSSGIVNAFPQKINKRTQEAARKELFRRFRHGGMWQCAKKYGTRKQNEDMKKLQSWMLDTAEQFRKNAPDDFRLLCTSWGDVATSQRSGVYVVKMKSTQQLKLGMSNDLQRRTNDQAQDITARAVFVLSDEMISNGFITEDDIDFVFGLDLPVFGGCDASQALQRTIIMNQICECIGTVAYEINSPGPLCEFLLMHGDDGLARLIDPGPYLKKAEAVLHKLEKHEAVRDFVATGQENMDTWRTAKDEGATIPQTKHLHTANRHESKFASRHLQQLLLDKDRIHSPAHPCTEYENGELQVDGFGEKSPYLQMLECSGILDRLQTAVKSGIKADIETELNNFPRNTYFSPADLDDDVTYAANAKTNIDNQLSQLPEFTIFSLRKCTWNVIKKSGGGEEWLSNRQLLKGREIKMPEIKIDDVTVVPSVRATIFFARMPASSTNRVVLVHNSTWTLVGPHQTFSHRFSAIATIMLVSGFNYLVGLLSEEGLYEVSRLMKSCALVLCGIGNKLLTPDGSRFLLYNLVFPKDLINARQIPGAAIVKRELKDGTGASFPFEALVLLLTKLGLDAVNTMLELVDSVCRFVEVDVKGEKFWLLATRTMDDRGNIRVDGNRSFHFLQFNNALEHVYLKRATDEIKALGSKITLKDVHVIVGRMNEGVERTNFPSGAKLDRTERLLKFVCRHYPLRTDILGELKSIHLHSSEIFNVHLDALKKYIDECHDGSLGDEYRERVFLPDFYKIDHGTYNYYKRLISRGEDGIGLYFRYELEGLGIYIQGKEKTDLAINEAQDARVEEQTTRGRARAKSYR